MRVEFLLAHRLVDLGFLGGRGVNVGFLAFLKLFHAGLRATVLDTQLALISGQHKHCHQ